MRCSLGLALGLLLLLLLLLGPVQPGQAQSESFESAFGLNSPAETSPKQTDREELSESHETEAVDSSLPGDEDLVEKIHERTAFESSKSEESSGTVPSLAPRLASEGKITERYVRYDSNDPEAGRYAPMPDQSVPIYMITESRLKDIRSEMMYWFFDKGGDNGNGDYQSDIHSSMPQIHKNFNFQLPFYGFRFNYTRVSINGYLEFSDPPEHYTYPLVFPIKDWPKTNDPSFIGIFFSKCRIGQLKPTETNQKKPGVYFRMERDLQRRTDQFGVEMRERLTWDIRQGVVGADTFVPKHAVIVTWKNVTFAGGIDVSLFRTNTFQLVLATDEVYTYAIFNYLELQWTTHTEASGDTTLGEGGSPAFIGFNAGNGTHSTEYMPYSQRSTLRDLTSRGWVNGFPGRHIFRIDEKIMLGNCNKDIAGANLPLVFAPESGNMLGGTVVNITGPCFEPNDKVICRFDTTEVTATVIDTNRAVCVQPMVLAEGYIRFAIAINNGRYDWKGKFFIETPSTATERIFFTTNAIHERDPAEIKMTWNAQNLTTNLDAVVQISLWGYRETETSPKFEYITTLQPGAPNTGYYTISPADFRGNENPYTNDLQFGFIQINLTDPRTHFGLDITPSLWSKPIPLGWYFTAQWERMYGNNWPQRLCNDWIMNDRYLKNFAAEVSLCPCTLEHALNDKGRFRPDYHCDRDSNPTCFYNKGALHCVTTGAPNLDGSEQQCCYDKNNMLMLTYDQQWGSRPRRSHDLGYLPWNEANKVPTLSHWFHDVVPMYTCCLWQEEQSVGCETYRFERRPSQDCIAYQAPAIGAVFGDPHIVTFDDLAYTFNGKGEFVLVRVNDQKDKLDVQARFEQLSSNVYGEVRATQLTAIAVRGNNSAIIEVKLRPRWAQWRYRLDVYADKEKVYFDRTSLKFQHFAGVVVYTPSYILNQSEVVIMFDTGVGIEVVENQGFMTARVYLPWTYMNKTRGLLGNWSNDMLDDLTNPDGTKISLPNVNDFQSLHEQFAINWMLEDREDPLKGGSMFKREFSRTASYYGNKTFVPIHKMDCENFLPANRTHDINRAKELCGENYQCRYDYCMSLDRDMAHFTRTYYDTYTQIRAINSKRTISCGILETPRFGRKSNFLFIPGTKVTFECNQDFVLIGDQRRICQPDGRWDLPEYGYTECLRQIEYSRRTLWMVMTAIAFVLLPGILIAAVICSCVYGREPGERDWSARSPASSGASPKYRAASPTSASTASFEHKAVQGGQQQQQQQQQQGSPHKRRRYDGVYHTHEPLPGKPDIDFEDKQWDLTLDDLTPSPTTSAGSPKQSDV